jgi:hypothetical protein
VREVILSRCLEYLRKRKATYRSVTRDISYSLEDKCPSHTRVWYWLKDLGQMVETLQQVKRLILAKNPATSSVGQPISIFPRKYRSQARHDLLQNAYSLLNMRSEWSRLFCLPFPPVFGTVAF